MDVFSAVAEGASRVHLRDAAVQAASQLGLFEWLARAPHSAGELAEKLGLARDHRVQALLDVLALEKLLIRAAADSKDLVTESKNLAADSKNAAASTSMRFSCSGTVRAVASLPALGWGRLAEVIRRDRPLEEPGVSGVRERESDRADPRAQSASEGKGPLERFHLHLLNAGADAAAELMTPLAKNEGGTLLDLGSGAGAYSRAWLRASDEVRAQLLDRPDVLALVSAKPRDATDPKYWDANHLDAGRIELCAADLFDPSPWPRANVVLLANLLHLFGPAEAQELVRRAAEAVLPGGLVVIKDLLLEDDRSGPAAGVLFSLNMALFTEEGRVHGKDALLGFLREAGLVELRLQTLASAPDAIAAEGRRPLEKTPGSR